MTTITSTEAGAVGRYINLGSDASQDDIGAQTWCFYCKPTGVPASTAGYLFGKTPSASTNGLRLAVVGATNTYLSFGAHSTTATSPNRSSSAGSVTLGNWQHIFATWAGTLVASQIRLYVNSTECTYGATSDGSGSIASDAANDLFLMNRGNSGALSRDFIGDYGYAARWNRVLSDAEMDTVIADGPLAVPTGLILCFANDQDYSTNALTAVARSTRVTGSTPPNTALGGDDSTIVAPLAGHAVTAGYAPSISQGGANTVFPLVGHIAVAGFVPDVPTQLYLSADYERSSANLSGSSIVGLGDSAIISILPKTCEGEASTPNIAWADPSCDVTGVNGSRPTFRFLAYKGTSGGLHGFSDGAWPSTRRPMFSYDDGLTWTYFSTCTPNSGSQYVEFRHATAFTQNKIRVSKSRQTTVHQVGDWLAALAGAHGFVVPTVTAAAYTPSGDMAGFAAQAFIADEFSPQVDSLGVTIPAMPFYAAEINDTSMMPASGLPKRFLIYTNGVHAGENISVMAFRALIEFICGTSSEALNIRRNYRVLFYPCWNAPGIAGGGVRGSWTQGVGGVDDPSRHCNESGTGLEIIDIPKSVIGADHDNYATVDSYQDLHGMYNDYSGSHQTIYIDDDNGLTERFRVLTASLGAESFPVLPAVMPAGGVSRYFREQGVTMSVSLEQGDGSPVSDAALINHGEALAKAFSALIDQGAFIISPAPGHISITGKEASVVQGGGIVVAPSAGHAAVVGYTSLVTQGASQTVSPAAGHLGIVGYTAIVVRGGAATVSPATGRVSFAGYNPTIPGMYARAPAGSGYAPRREMMTRPKQLNTVRH